MEGSDSAGYTTAADQLWLHPFFISLITSFLVSTYNKVYLEYSTVDITMNQIFEFKYMVEVVWFSILHVVSANIGVTGQIVQYVCISPEAVGCLYQQSVSVYSLVEASAIQENVYG